VRHAAVANIPSGSGPCRRLQFTRPASTCRASRFAVDFGRAPAHTGAWSMAQLACTAVPVLVAGWRGCHRTVLWHPSRHFPVVFRTSWSSFYGWDDSFCLTALSLILPSPTLTPATPLPPSTSTPTPSILSQISEAFSAHIFFSIWVVREVLSPFPASSATLVRSFPSVYLHSVYPDFRFFPPGASFHPIRTNNRYLIFLFIQPRLALFRSLTPRQDMSTIWLGWSSILRRGTIPFLRLLLPPLLRSWIPPRSCLTTMQRMLKAFNDERTETRHISTHSSIHPLSYNTVACQKYYFHHTPS